MRQMILSLASAALLGLAASASQAMPVSDVGNPAPHVTLVAGGCGIGFHRGPYGGCRPNRGPLGPVPYWRGPGWRYYHGCWRGPAGRVHCH
ncbi:MAG TPA: hypothetical protein VKV77_08015 [Methylovirgula sp.]|nr:hypothetical protein [Methylovirgula sp.]